MNKSKNITKRKTVARKKPVKAIIIDFAGVIPKARFMNTAGGFFRGSDLDIAYKAMRRGLIKYKQKMREKLEKENSDG